MASELSERQLIQLEGLLIKLIWDASPTQRIPIRTTITAVRRRIAQAKRREREKTS